jgi:hypothetical protein
VVKIPSKRVRLHVVAPPSKHVQLGLRFGGTGFDRMEPMLLTEQLHPETKTISYFSRPV